MSVPELKTREKLIEDFLRRFRAYTNSVTYYGTNSIIWAIAKGVGGMTYNIHRLWVALAQRFSLLAASGAALDEVLREHGVARLGATRAKVLVVPIPAHAVVTAFNGSLIEVDDSTDFDVADVITLYSATNPVVKENLTIAAKTTGTGVNGGDELDVTAIAGSYNLLTSDVNIIRRVTIAAGTQVDTASGQQFTTLDDVTTGDLDPVMDGESGSVSLVDKVWCECTATGESGNIAALTVTGFSPAVDGINAAENPELGGGGAESEADHSAKYRAAHVNSICNVETQTWIEAIAVASNKDVLRAVAVGPGTLAGYWQIKVVRRNGGTFSAAQLTAITSYINARMRSTTRTEVLNVTLTAVVVDLTGTLDPDADLETVWRRGSSALADFIDFRRWAFGGDVDEADLLSILNAVEGIATIQTSSFLPASDVVVADDSLPYLASFRLADDQAGTSRESAFTQGY